MESVITAIMNSAASTEEKTAIITALNREKKSDFIKSIEERTEKEDKFIKEINEVCKHCGFWRIETINVANYNRNFLPCNLEEIIINQTYKRVFEIIKKHEDVLRTSSLRKIVANYVFSNGASRVKFEMKEVEEIDPGKFYGINFIDKKNLYDIKFMPEIYIENKFLQAKFDTCSNFKENLKQSIKDLLDSIS